MGAPPSRSPHGGQPGAAVRLELRRERPRAGSEDDGVGVRGDLSEQPLADLCSSPDLDPEPPRLVLEVQREREHAGPAGDRRRQPELPTELLFALVQDHVRPELGGEPRGLQAGGATADHRHPHPAPARREESLVEPPLTAGARARSAQDPAGERAALLVETDARANRSGHSAPDLRRPLRVDDQLARHADQVSRAAL